MSSILETFSKIDIQANSTIVLLNKKGCSWKCAVQYSSESKHPELFYSSRIANVTFVLCVFLINCRRLCSGKNDYYGRLYIGKNDFHLEW